MEENNTYPNPTNHSSVTWQPIVTNVLIFLHILISLGKQFLNNNKHIKLNTTIDTILTRIKKNSSNMNTEGDALINPNIPEHLKTSQKEN